MEYRVNPRTGDSVSLLGFGAMRLKSDGNNVDIDGATELLRYAVDNGVNFIDTALLYGFGANEKAVGLILENLGYRSKVFISTKMNRLLINSLDDMYSMFDEELSNLRTDYVDYYFIHNVISFNDMRRLFDMGLSDFIRDKKDSGEIVNMGFSYHGSYDDFVKILDLYDWDVTLLQYNYLDSNIQAGLKGIKLAGSRNMSVVIMEPLKGGLLAGDMPGEIDDLIDSSVTSRSCVDLALSWVYDCPEVTCVLSGMNSLDMLVENIRITSDHEVNPLSSEELDVICDMKDVFSRLYEIDCTGCNYCMPCPRGIHIPEIFKMYNDRKMFPENSRFGLDSSFILYTGNILGVTGEAHDASLCVDCGLCTSKCPQQLDIPELLRMVNKSYHAGFVKPFVPLVKKLMKLL